MKRGHLPPGSWITPALAALASLAFSLPAFDSMGWLEPYMDEEFHVPQAQAYCRGDFGRWDPKITTLPGLYLASAAMRAPLAAVVGAAGGGLEGGGGGGDGGAPPFLCGATQLRAINLLFAASTAAISARIMQRLFPSSDRTAYLSRALSAVLFPLHFFYLPLYYTDPACVFLVLWMYERTLARDVTSAGIMGALSVLFRQTSIMWVVFCAGISVLEVVEAEGAGARRLGMGGSKKDDGNAAREPQGGDDELFSLPGQAVRAVGLLLSRKLVPCLSMCWMHLAVVCTFAAFVKLNGGVAVGDREQHQAVMHLTQPLYFSLFCSATLAPFLCLPSVLPFFAAWCLKHPLTASIFVAIAALCVHRATLAHPYLLADNRHYTFYLWKNVMARHEAVRYSLIPGYLFSAWSISQRLRTALSPLSILLFWVCTVCVLVPAGLLEFRYFSIPTLLVLLHIPPPRDATGWLAELSCLAGFAVVDAATLYLYVGRPFHWPDGSVARFMW